jgi:hypothetical protein
MPTEPIRWERLAEPFAADEIEWRLARTGERDGKPWAKCLAYVTARAIQNRLDEVFGIGGWKNEYREGPGGGCICRIWFKNDEGEWVWREDGAGDLASSDGLSESDAQKGTFSNALKRAGSALSVGRYLYSLPEGFANIHPNGQHYAKPRTGSAFKWDPPELPKWALPKPRTNAVEREHATLIAWLKEQGATLDETVSVKINGNPMPLKAYMLAQWPEAQKKYAVASTLAGLVTEATGAEFKPSPVA